MNIRPYGISGVSRYDGHSYDGYTNIFLATISDNPENEGRIVRVLFAAETTQLSIQLWLNGNKEFFIDTNPLEMHEWSKLELRQSLIDSKYIFSIWVNGVEFHSQEAIQTEIFNYVNVFLGDPTYRGLPADICNSWFHTSSGSMLLANKGNLRIYGV